jgi:hypothetical protein
MVTLPPWLLSIDVGAGSYQYFLSNFTPVSVHMLKCSCAHLSCHFMYCSFASIGHADIMCCIVSSNCCKVCICYLSLCSIFLLLNILFVTLGLVLPLFHFQFPLLGLPPTARGTCLLH